MKQFSIVFCLLAMTRLASADPQPSNENYEATKAIAIAQAAQDNLTGQLSTAKQEQDEKEVALKALIAEFKQTGCYAVGPNASCPNGVPADLQKRARSLSSQILQLNNQMTPIARQISDYESKLKALSKANLKANATLKEITDDQKARLNIITNGMAINRAWSDLKVDNSLMSAALDKLNTVMDASVTGVYLQDKIGALLNSKLFCDAVDKKCLKPGRFVIERSNMSEIFPETSQSNSRSGDEQRARTYDKTSK